MNYYNEHDRKAAAWLRELIKAGHIADGVVDERSIAEIQPAELAGYTQCHFFAGIGGWSLALRLAGWPDDRPVWTGSCPCQPFSHAGKQLGTADERHLWPVWFNLIRERRPAVVLGEQVASKAALGWFDGVSADLETADYATAAADLPAASVGSPQIRQRLFWLAHAHGRHSSNRELQRGRQHGQQQEDHRTRGMADAEHNDRRPDESRRGPQRRETDGRTCRLGNPDSAGREEQRRPEPIPAELQPAQCGGNAWSPYDLLPCTDGKTRRIEPGTFPLAHGIPGRVGLLRGYGNAIVPQVAAVFIEEAAHLLNP